jgi:uncharacterized protein YbjT (DUF2867 family)
MKITVFGATGHVGALFIGDALKAGHEIVAYARKPEKIRMKNPKLSVAAGDLDDADAIEKAVAGSDAVVSVIGPVGRQDKLIFAPAYEKIITAMKKRGVKRLIALGTPSIPSSLDRPSLIFGALIVVVGMLIHKGYEDIQRVGELVRESGLDWTLARVPLLTNRPARGKITVGNFGNGVWWPRLSRADFSQFLLAQLTDRAYVGKAPAISN